MFEGERVKAYIFLTKHHTETTFLLLFGPCMYKMRVGGLQQK